jgi:hypothetical protein
MPFLTFWKEHKLGEFKKKVENERERERERKVRNEECELLVFETKFGRTFVDALP